MNNKYKNAMDGLKFKSDFEFNAVRAARLAKEKRRKTRQIIFYAVDAAVVCACIAVAVIFVPKLIADNKSFLTEQTPEATQRIVVVSTDYGCCAADMITPKAGDAHLIEGVANAVNDPANAGSYFYVEIYATLPEAEQSAYSRDHYEYNGRTVSEWSVLADLAADAYPYNEYNGDMGGNVTEAEWKAAAKEAKQLNAQENYDAAVNQYNTEMLPLYEQARKDWQQSECTRLTSAGYDVFLSSEGAIRGLLSAEQLKNFNVNPECAYIIDWVRDENGIVNWEE